LRNNRRILTRDEARTFYDRFGRKRDWHSIYEGRVLNDLITGGAFERVRSVLELLPAEEIVILLAEARRVPTPYGRLCLIILTHGTGLFSRFVVWLWKRAHAIRPRFAGGCRPVDLRQPLRV
jgi:hypothetical protein